MSQDPMPLFHQLQPIHQTIFRSAFTRLKWSMVASFECGLARRGSLITLEKTTFSMSPTRDPDSSCTLVFGVPIDAELGETITSEAVTKATGHEGDIKFVLGFADDEYVAMEAFNKHLHDTQNEPNGSYAVAAAHAVSER
jgi:hypothetical protein